MFARVLALLTLAGCGIGALDEGPGGDTCDVALEFSPTPAIAGEEVRATTVVLNSSGVASYTWSVRFNGAPIPFEDALANGSAIMFVPELPGIYDVTVDVDAAQPCPQASARLSVQSPNANTTDVRLRVIPPLDLDIPPFERVYAIPGGGDYAMGPVVLDPGRRVDGVVRDGGVGVPAYLELTPVGMSGAAVEAYAGSDGAFRVNLLSQMHEVLVIPASNAFAPRRVMLDPTAPTASISIGVGSAVTGVVRHGAAPVANAKVQLVLDGVPSTLGTTAADGSFSVRAWMPATGPTRVTVTPPVSTGLPRLEAIGTLDLTQPLTITYANDLATRNVGGVVVRRNGSPLANATVSIVGTIAAAGTVTTGATSLTGTGTARVAVTANGSGVLPSALVPAAPLDAVIDVPVAAPARNYAVDDFDTSTAVPTTIDAPTMTTRMLDSGPQTLSGVRLTLVPVGALALAGMPAVDFVGDAMGRVTATLAGDGVYDLVWTDPAGRAGQLVVRDVVGGALAPSYMLPPALALSGTLSVTGNPNPVRGAVVHILCVACGSGVDSERPIAEVASDQLGDFEVAIPDPGTL